MASTVNSRSASITLGTSPRASLNRPVKMTNSTKAAVWTAVWQPWGAAQSITGSATLNARFPGQWFQVEAGLHYNWHRHYDPSLGRYTQPDPLGFVDGPSVYGYARNRPQQLVDPSGRNTITAGATLGGTYGGPSGAVLGAAAGAAILLYQCFKEKPGENEEERCKREIQICRSDCRDQYVDDPDSLPGTGNDWPGRQRRCIRECAEKSGCDKYF